MDGAPKLKVVGRHGVGVENIDLEAAAEKGIWVVNTPEANDLSVAEHFFGLALMLSKRLPEGNLALREGRWPSRHECIGNELHGKTLGIIGFGRIGKAVGRIGFRGFDMRILYHDTVRYEETEKDLSARKVTMEEVLSLSDYVSIHLPETPETRGLIGEREFSLMKPTAFIFNMARGSSLGRKGPLSDVERTTDRRGGLRRFWGGACRKGASPAPARQFHWNPPHGSQNRGGLEEDEPGGSGHFEGPRREGTGLSRQPSL